jgi:hypothetical protein
LLRFGHPLTIEGVVSVNLADADQPLDRTIFVLKIFH